MRKIQLSEGFCLTGTIPGAVKPDVVLEITLPFCLQSVQDVCGQEGLFLRSWEVHTLLKKPEEPAHSHAERTLLTLDGLLGTGEVCIGTAIRVPIQPYMVLDVTEALRDGFAEMRLHFPPQHPRLLCGEHGRDLIAQGGLFSAELRNIFHLQIHDVSVDCTGLVKVHVHAYGAGKVRLRLRLMIGEEMLWSENSTVPLVVGDQVVLRHVEEKFMCKGAVMQATIDMGGEGCDSCEAVCSFVPETPRYTAHFRALPSMRMLREIQDAGFDGVVFYEFPHRMLLKACSELGLHVQWCREEIHLNPIVSQGAEYSTVENGCLLVGMLDEEENHSLVQAQRLQDAVLVRRVCAEPIAVLAWCRQRDAQDGLFDAEGRPRMALFAMRNALGRIVMCAKGQRRIYHPYEEFCEEILLLCAEPDQKPAAVQVQLYAWSGREIVCRVFPFCMKERVQSLGVLRARLPMEPLQGLMLRMQCIRDGKILAVHHVYYSCADENNVRIPFPEADLAECVDGELCNVSDAIAMGVTIRCGEKTLLNYGAILPQERISIAYNGDVMIKYGNTVKKGGKECAKQRFLRGVCAHQHAASSDPEADHFGC